MIKTLVKTFDGDIYIIEKSPEQIMAQIKGLDMVGMPNGSYIHKKSISALQTYEDYTFQVDQKQRHKKGQYLHNGEWNDNVGSIGVSAHLEKITGSLKVLEDGQLRSINAPEQDLLGKNE